MTVTTQDDFGSEFSPGPNNWGVVRHLVMALNAGIEYIATLEFNGDDIALRVIVGALGALVYTGAVANYRFGRKRLNYNFFFRHLT